MRWEAALRIGAASSAKPVSLGLEPRAHETTLAACAASLAAWVEAVDREPVLGEVPGRRYRLYLEATAARGVRGRFTRRAWSEGLVALEAGKVLSLELWLEVPRDPRGDAGDDSGAFDALAGVSFESIQHRARGDCRVFSHLQRQVLGSDPLAWWMEWARVSAVELQVRAGWIERSDRASGKVTGMQATGFSDAFWGLFLGGEMLRRLGGRVATLQRYPGIRATDLSTPDTPLVYLQLSDDPSDVPRDVYECVFSFLQPVLDQHARPRISDDVLAELAAHLVDDTDQRAMSPAARAILASLPAPDVVEPHAAADPDAAGVARGEPYRSTNLPNASPELCATFKWEDETDDGEDIGPLIVSHPKLGVVWESDEWMRESTARELAREKGWRYAVDR